MYAYMCRERTEDSPMTPMTVRMVSGETMVAS
jgi:hypothetical protein